MGTAIAVASALGAATCFGSASAVQHDEAARVARRGPLDPRTLAALARSGRWLLTSLGEGAAVLLQAVALANGSVALVQALLVLQLPVAVVVSGRLGAARLARAAVGGLLVTTAGVGLVAAVAPPDAAAAGTPAAGPALTALVLLGVVVAGLLLLARARPGLAAVATGAAAGCVVGAAAVLLAVCARQVGAPLLLLASWPPYALAVLGVLGLLLVQVAFQTGAVGPPLAALSLLEPVAAVAVAALVLGSPLPTGRGGLVAAAAGGVLAAVGVAVLSGARR